MVTRTLDFIARNKDQEGMRKTARGRKIRLQRLLKENPDYLQTRKTVQSIQFSFAQTNIKSDLVLRAENISKSFGPLTLFENLSFDVVGGQALGITGPNGTGKTTLLKLALGQLAPDAGTIRLGANLKIGYLDQQANTLNPDHTVLEEMHSVRPDLTPQALRSRLGAFLFSGEDVFKKVGDLSGGQQNRLMLCRLVLAQPDVLILDEPTNHLDIPSRQMLEEALADYNGAIIAVSHDRYFLDRIADSLLVIGTDAAGRRQVGQTRLILSAAPDTDGVYSTYAQLIEQNRQAAQHQKNCSKTENRPPSGQPKTPTHLRPFNKYTIEQIEEMIEQQERTIEQMQNAFGDEKIYLNHQLLKKLQADFDAEKQKLALLYEVWEYRAAD